jgi:competence protein ComEC
LPMLTTVGAQAAVAPIILSVFGTVPLAAPVTNLIAGPIVAGTTLLAAAGVVFPPLASVARHGGALVLRIAGAAADGPQLGMASVVLLAIAGTLVAIPISRPIAVAMIIVVALSAPWRAPWPEVPTVTVLDVGQGDAILLQTPDGSTLLMDGGSDPNVLDRALRRHGVRSVDVVVVSHDDIDHAGGLIELVASGSVGSLMVSRFGSQSHVRDAAAGDSAQVIEIGAGYRFTVGRVLVEVLSPSRRFASDNDGSIVLLLTSDRTMLLPGDIEAVGQRELVSVRPDVLLVPHHGSATTDLRWLEATIGPFAVLSYGSNSYGHPHPDVMRLLESLSIDIRTTKDEGDISIPLLSVNR